MFRRDNRAIAHIENFLKTRRSYSRPRKLRTDFGIAALATAAASAAAFAISGADFAIAGTIGTAATALFGARALAGDRLPISPAEEVLERAEPVAKAMRDLLEHRRLHIALHPGITTTLNECAGFWRRIRASSEDSVWDEESLSSHWLKARLDWEAAADLAMAEAIILVNNDMNANPPGSRIEEVVEGLIDRYVFNRTPGAKEPLPPSFQRLRELAEKLRTLAAEVEEATRSLPRGQRPQASSDASARLDEVLGELRYIRDAESELKQDLRN